MKKFGKPNIDLFASRLNHKLYKYVSYRPDPSAFAVDAFSISWSNCYVYIFAPMSPLNMVFRKIVEDETEALAIATLWNTQSWWPQLAELLVDFPVKLPPVQKILYQPNNPDRVHPLQKLRLGKFYKAEEFRANLPNSSYKHGDNPLKNSMSATSISGSSFQNLGKVIHFNLL